jgi:signal transduction histidine kinase
MNTLTAPAPFGPERLADLVEALPVGVFILGGDGTAIYANAVAKSLLGRGILEGDHANTIGPRFATFRAGTNEPYPTDELPIVRALRGLSTKVDDLEIERDGQRITFEVTAGPILDAQGRVVFAVAVFQDITERRAAQRALAELNETLEDEVARRTTQLEKANRARSAFLMNVSHELRTPLNHIIGFNDLLADRVEDEKTRKLAETVRASGHDLLEKVDALIELARAEAEPQSFPQTEFDLEEMLEAITKPLGIRCETVAPLGSVRGSEEAARRILSDVFVRANSDTVAASTEEIGAIARLVVKIPGETFAGRVRALAGVFGGPQQEDRYRQQQVDLRLAVACAHARVLGGDIAAAGEAAVHVILPFART